MACLLMRTKRQEDVMFQNIFLLYFISRTKSDVFINGTHLQPSGRKRHYRTALLHMKTETDQTFATFIYLFVLRTVVNVQDKCSHSTWRFSIWNAYNVSKSIIFSIYIFLRLVLDSHIFRYRFIFHI